MIGSKAMATPNKPESRDPPVPPTLILVLSVAAFLGGCFMSRETESVFVPEEFVTLYTEDGQEIYGESPAHYQSVPRNSPHIETGKTLCWISAAVFGISLLVYFSRVASHEEKERIAATDRVDTTADEENKERNSDEAPDRSGRHDQQRSSEVIKVEPASFSDYISQARTYHKQREYEKAITVFSQAIQHHPLNSNQDLDGEGRVRFEHNRAVYKLGLAQTYHGRALAYYEHGDYAKAITDFTEAIQLNPDDGQSHRCRARAYQGNGNLAKASTDLAKAEELGYKS